MKTDKITPGQWLDLLEQTSGLVKTGRHLGHNYLAVNNKDEIAVLSKQQMQRQGYRKLGLHDITAISKQILEKNGDPQVAEEIAPKIAAALKMLAGAKELKMGKSTIRIQRVVLRALGNALAKTGLNSWASKIRARLEAPKNEIKEANEFSDIHEDAASKTLMQELKKWQMQSDSGSSTPSIEDSDGEEMDDDLAGLAGELAEQWTPEALLAPIKQKIEEEYFDCIDDLDVDFDSEEEIESDNDFFDVEDGDWPLPENPAPVAQKKVEPLMTLSPLDQLKRAFKLQFFPLVEWNNGGSTFLVYLLERVFRINENLQSSTFDEKTGEFTLTLKEKKEIDLQKLPDENSSLPANMLKKVSKAKLSVAKDIKGRINPETHSIEFDTKSLVITGKAWFITLTIYLINMMPNEAGDWIDFTGQGLKKATQSIRAQDFVNYLEMNMS